MRRLTRPSRRTWHLKLRRRTRTRASSFLSTMCCRHYRVSTDAINQKVRVSFSGEMLDHQQSLRQISMGKGALIFHALLIMTFSKLSIKWFTLFLYWLMPKRDSALKGLRNSLRFCEMSPHSFIICSLGSLDHLIIIESWFKLPIIFHVGLSHVCNVYDFVNNSEQNLIVMDLLGKYLESSNVVN